MSYWNIPGHTFEFDNPVLGTREVTVCGRRGTVNLSGEQDDDRKPFELTMPVSEMRQVANEILRVCDLAEVKLEAAE